MLQDAGDLSVRLYTQEMEKRECRPVDGSDLDLLPDLVLKMARLCREHGGAAIAAPQVGVNIQLAVIIEPIALVLVNPEITVFAGRDILAKEGCLSLPPTNSCMARVRRSEFIDIRTGNIANPYANERLSFRDYGARVVQHEVDHLSGVFIVNRCGPIERQLVLRRFATEMKARKMMYEGHHG